MVFWRIVISERFLNFNYIIWSWLEVKGGIKRHNIYKSTFYKKAMTNEEPKPRLKLIAKRDFDIVRTKYKFQSETPKTIIESADPWDVLALTVIPGSGLKILDAKILNEESQTTFLRLLREGI